MIPFLKLRSDFRPLASDIRPSRYSRADTFVLGVFAGASIATMIIAALHFFTR